MLSARLTLQVRVAGALLSIMQVCGLFMGRGAGGTKDSFLAKLILRQSPLGGCLSRLSLHFENG